MVHFAVPPAAAPHPAVSRVSMLFDHINSPHWCRLLHLCLLLLFSHFHFHHHLSLFCLLHVAHLVQIGPSIIWEEWMFSVLSVMLCIGWLSVSQHPHKLIQGLACAV
jgi:hypothetical protein